jgi:hypothetical protein
MVQFKRKEEMLEEEVRNLPSEIMEIKGFTVYFVDDEVYKGLCAYVFKNGRYITEDLAIWHKPYEKDIPANEVLKEMYIKNLNNKLYTEEELTVITDYDDYTQKSYYLHNYYGNQVAHLSWFGIEIDYGKYDMDVAKDGRVEELKEIYTINNEVAFCYNKPEDAEFVRHQAELLDILNAARKTSEENEEYMIKAFEYEMDNHEYAINWQGDWDVCSCFGRCKYSDSKTYRDYLKEMGKENMIKAYSIAKENHMKRAANW